MSHNKQKATLSLNFWNKNYSFSAKPKVKRIYINELQNCKIYHINEIGVGPNTLFGVIKNTRYKILAMSVCSSVCLSVTPTKSVKSGRKWQKVGKSDKE